MRKEEKRQQQCQMWLSANYSHALYNSHASFNLAILAFGGQQLGKQKKLLTWLNLCSQSVSVLVFDLNRIISSFVRR